MMDHQQQRPLSVLLRTPESLAMWKSVPRLPKDAEMDVRKDHNQNHSVASSEDEEQVDGEWNEEVVVRSNLPVAPSPSSSPAQTYVDNEPAESDSAPIDLSQPSKRLEAPSVTPPAVANNAETIPNYYVCKKRKAMLNTDWRSQSESNIPNALGSKQARLDKLVSHLRKSNVKEAPSSSINYDDDADDNSQDRPLRIVEEEEILPSTDHRHTARQGHSTTRDTIADRLKREEEEEDDIPDQEDCEEEPFSSSHLRRTASESVLPPAESLDEFRRHLLQYQLLQGMMPGASLNKQLEEAVGGNPDTLSTLSSCPPWLYLGLYGYSHLLQSFQAQDFLRNIASNQASKATSSRSGLQSPSVPSPAASTSDEAESGAFGMAAGNLAGGKRRSPRALTGKHVRLGTGASPTTLQTLRMKIEERQRMKKMGGNSMAATWSSGVGQHNKSKTKTGKNAKSRKK